MSRPFWRDPAPLVTRWRSRTRAKLSDRRKGYGMAVPLSTTDRKALEQRADAELRPLSNYVSALVLEELRRGRLV